MKIYRQIEKSLTIPRNKTLFFGIIVFITFLAIYFLNFLQPLFNDDWIYSFFTGENLLTKERSPRISSMSDVFHSQYAHYFAWGGRTVAHIILQTLLYLGSPLRELLNSTVYLLFVFSIYRIVNRETINIKLFVVINLIIWFFQPAFAGTILWVTGSSNYLWCTTIILLFLYPYTTLFVNEKSPKKGILFSIFFLFAGVIAGWTNENMSIALILAVLASIVYFKKRNINIPTWVYTSFIGAIIGCILLIMAPGNYVRYQLELDTNQAPLFVFFIKRFVTVLQSYFFYGLSISMIYALGLILHHHYGLKDKHRKVKQLSLVFFGMGILAMLAMSGSPTFPPRAWFGIVTCLIVAIALLYANLDFSVIVIKQSSRVIIGFGLAIFIGQYYLGAKDLSQIKTIFAEREAIIINEKTKGNKDIIFTNHLNLATDFPHTSDLDSDPTNWKNELYSIYYDIDSVRVKP